MKNKGSEKKRIVGSGCVKWAVIVFFVLIVLPNLVMAVACWYAESRAFSFPSPIGDISLSVEDVSMNMFENTRCKGMKIDSEYLSASIGKSAVVWRYKNLLKKEIPLIEFSNATFKVDLKKLLKSIEEALPKTDATTETPNESNTDDTTQPFTPSKKKDESKPWRVERIELKGGGEVTYGAFTTTVSNLAVALFFHSREGYSRASVQFTTEEGAILRLYVSDELYGYSYNLNTSGVPLPWVDRLLREFNAGAVCLQQGHCSATSAGTYLNGTVKGDLEAEIYSAIFESTGWKTKEVSPLISAQFEISSQSNSIRLLVNDESTDSSLTGTLSIGETIALKNVTLDIGKSEIVKSSWGLDFADYEVSGGILFSGELELNMNSGIELLGSGELSANDFTLDMSSIGYKLKKASGGIKGDFKWNLGTFSLTNTEGDLSFSVFGTEWFAYLSPKAKTHINCDLSVTSLSTVYDAKLARKGLFTASSKGRIINDSVQVTANLKVFNTHEFAESLYKRSLADVRKQFIFDGREFEADIEYSSGIKAAVLDYSALIGGFSTFHAGKTREVSGISLSGRADFSGDVRVSANASIAKLDELGECEFGADASFAAKDTTISLSLNKFNIAQGKALVVLKDDGITAGGKLETVALAPLLKALYEYGLLKDFDAEVSGTLTGVNFSYDLSEIGFQIGGISELNAEFVETRIAGVDGKADIRIALGEQTRISGTASKLTVSSASMQGIGSASGILAQDLSFSALLGEDISASMNGELSADSIQLPVSEINAHGVSWMGEVSVSIGKGTINFGDSKFDISIQSASWQNSHLTGCKGSVSTTESRELKVNLKLETLTTPQAKLENPTVDGVISVGQNNLSFNGKVDSKDVSVQIPGWAILIPSISLDSEISLSEDGSKISAKGKINTMFGNGEVSVALAGDKLDAKFTIAISELVDAVSVSPRLAEMLGDLYAGSIRVDCALDLEDGTTNASGSISLNLDEAATQDELFMGEGLHGSVSGSVKLVDGRIVFDIASSLQGEQFLIGLNLYEMAQPLTVIFRGSYDPSSSNLIIDELKLSYESLFEAITFSGSLNTTSGDANLSGEFANVNMGNVISTFYQVAEGSEQLFSISGIYSSSFAISCSEGRQNISVEGKTTNAKGFLVPYIGATSVRFELPGESRFELVLSRDVSSEIKAQMSVLSSSVFFEYSKAFAQLKAFTLDAGLSLKRFEYKLEGKLGFSGEMHVDGHDNTSFLADIVGMELSLPFFLVSSEVEAGELSYGYLNCSSVTLAGLRGENIQLPIALWNNVFAITKSAKLAGEAGSFELSPVLIEEVNKDSRLGETELEFSNLKTQMLAKQLGVTVFDGTVSGKYNLWLEEGRIQLTGGMEMDAFGGAFSLGSAYIKPGKYPVFGFEELLLKDIDLLEVTGIYENDAASMQGNLNGYIRNFVWYGGPSRFTVWLYSTEHPDRKQTVTAGMVANIEEARGYMKTLNISIFDYKYFRIGAKLENGVIQISSLEGGVPGKNVDNILLKGKRMILFSYGKLGFFRLILRVAGSAKGDWNAVWSSIKKGMKNMSEGKALDIDV